MKPNLFNLIIAIAFVSLMGVVFTQLFWVRNAIQLKEDQFRQSVSIAMKTVFNHLLEQQTDSVLSPDHASANHYTSGKRKAEIIPESLLDSLIRAEMGCMRIHKDYIYGVYDREIDSLRIASYRGYAQELMTSEHQQSIKALLPAGDPYFSMYFPHQQSIIYRQLLIWMVISAFFLIIVIYSFWLTIRTVLRQKKLSEMKTDFINNMTHEFKTPIATISLAAEMLTKPGVLLSKEKALKYAGVIQSENNRLQNQVEQVLQSAMLEKGETKLKIREVNIHELLEDIADAFEIRIKERSGHLRLKLDSNTALVRADRMHLRNIFSNLVENAIKYSEDAPEISIHTKSENNGIKVSVADKGIGILAENQSLIFKNLYRVHTGDLHDVKGFGIGLYYVKKLVELHQGTIQVQSEPGNGSVFSVYLPFLQS